MAATRKWIATTESGAKDAADLIGIKYFRGDSSKNYHLVDHEEVAETTAKGENVWFLQGLIVDGKVTDPSRLRISEKSRDACSSCSTLVPCLKNVREPHKDTVLSLCNYCLTFHDNPRIRDLGGIDVCGSCTVKTCANHPLRVRRPAHQEGTWSTS